MCERGFHANPQFQRLAARYSKEAALTKGGFFPSARRVPLRAVRAILFYVRAIPPLEKRFVNCLCARWRGVRMRCPFAPRPAVDRITLGCVPVRSAPESGRLAA